MRIPWLTLACDVNTSRSSMKLESVSIWLATAWLSLLALPANAEWRLAWSDEFNGAIIDTNHWSFDTGNGLPGMPGWGNNELEYYRPENASVSNGVLRIVARAEDFGGQHYTSAKLKSRGFFSQAGGRFEFRARLPQGKGYWPALWLMPENATYGRWAASGEIDVMENRGRDPGTVLGTLHFGGAFPKNTHSRGPSFNFPPGDSVTNFHIYAVEWATNSIKWYVDSTLYEVQTNWWSSGGKYPAPFNQPFYILMNLAVGGNFGGDPDTNTVFPGEMQVDYVRVYKQVPAPETTPTLKTDLGSVGQANSDADSSSISGKNLLKVKAP